MFRHTVTSDKVCFPKWRLKCPRNFVMSLDITSKWIYDRVSTSLTCFLHIIIIIVKVFIKHKILSVDTVLSTSIHTHTYRHPHTQVYIDYTIFLFTQLNRHQTETWGGGRLDSNVEQKMWCIFWREKMSEGMVWRSPERVSDGGEGHSPVDGLKTEKVWEPTVSLWLLVPNMKHIVFALIQFDVENVLIITRPQKCSVMLYWQSSTKLICRDLCRKLRFSVTI